MGPAGPFALGVGHQRCHQLQFDLYEQYDSLTMTETELLRQGIKTKTGRSFTRFSIKSILQNPVYLIADKDAYQYFVDNEAELFSPESGKKASPPS